MALPLAKLWVGITGVGYTDGTTQAKLWVGITEVVYTDGTSPRQALGRDHGGRVYIWQIRPPVHIKLYKYTVKEKFDFIRILI